MSRLKRREEDVTPSCPLLSTSTGTAVPPVVTPEIPEMKVLEVLDPILVTLLSPAVPLIVGPFLGG
jgi:hypothetical protein